MTEATKTPDATLISALEALARDIQSDDGIANAVIAEAAQRLREHGEAWGNMRREFQEFDGLAMTLKTAMQIIDRNDPRIRTEVGR